MLFNDVSETKQNLWRHSFNAQQRERFRCVCVTVRMHHRKKHTHTNRRIPLFSKIVVVQFVASRLCFNFNMIIIYTNLAICRESPIVLDHNGRMRVCETLENRNRGKVADCGYETIRVNFRSNQDHVEIMQCRCDCNVCAGLASCASVPLYKVSQLHRDLRENQEELLRDQEHA